MMFEIFNVGSRTDVKELLELTLKIAFLLVNICKCLCNTNLKMKYKQKV